MNVCAICLRHEPVARLHAGTERGVCGVCVERLSERLLDLDAHFGVRSPAMKQAMDVLDPDSRQDVEDPEERQELASAVAGPDAGNLLLMAEWFRDMGLDRDARRELAKLLKHARGELLAQALDAVFGKAGRWKGDLKLLRDALYPA